MKLDSRYSFLDYMRLIYSYLITKIFFTNCRLIRQPTRIRGFQHMKIGTGFTTGQYCRIEAQFSPEQSESKSLVIGNNVQINDRCHIAAIYDLRIGNHVLIASNVFITDHDHGNTDLTSLQQIPAAREIVYASTVIGDNVWIGENVVILKGIKVGNNSVIGAGSVVTKNVPPFSVVAGVPGRVVKSYTI